MRSSNIQRISVVDDRLFVGVSFFEPPIVWEIAVIDDYRCWSRSLRFVFSAIDRPDFLA